MLLELHILQNFAPSNLNRDDTGSPKTCEFGGYRRARISSQAIKRAIRREFDIADLIPEEQRAIRSKRFVELLAQGLSRRGRPEEQSAGVAEAGLALLDITLAKDNKTQYLLYLGAAELENIVEFCDAQWESLAVAAAEKKSTKKGTQDESAKKLAKQLQAALDGGRAADLALFGRMLADLPERNIDAACQVAHAISTHQVSSEFDYYTAVDDLKPEDTAGADMIGTIEFNSACYYRYANIDLAQLARNLGGDADLAVKTVRAFLVASRDAIPTGKQNSFAARSAPSFILTVVRPAGAWSLANAFVNPVRPASGGLIANSMVALDKHWGDLSAVYGAPSGASLAMVATGETELPNLGAARVATFNDLMERTITAVSAGV